MAHDHKVSVAALVTNDLGQILLVNSPWRGWEYPGGLIEPGETFQEALKREIREEAGVEVQITGFVGICKNLGSDIVNIDFTCRYVSGELTPSPESTEVIWATAEEAMERITFPLTKKRLANMLRGDGMVHLFGFRRDPFTVAQDEVFPINRTWPTVQEAQLLLAEGASRNPGPWADHSRHVARCAKAIAEASGMDGQKAYVLGLLHDIGRRFGITHLTHTYDGWQYLLELGYPDAAKAALTHSFCVKNLGQYIGKQDLSPDKLARLESALAGCVYDDYDRLIQLCDALVGADGVPDMEGRMLDVKARYGYYPQEKWDRNFALRSYFEIKMGMDLYEVLR